MANHCFGCPICNAHGQERCNACRGKRHSERVKERHPVHGGTQYLCECECGQQWWVTVLIDASAT